MRSIKAVLFDLDGTLLPMDNDLFIQVYFGALSRLFPDIPSRVLAGHILASTEAAVRDPGGATIAEKFAGDFIPRLNKGTWEELEPVFTHFYAEDFPKLGAHFPAHPGARAAYEKAKALGLRTALATNPIFPRAATEARIAWAGFAPEEFELITAYEDSHSCKPQEAYYREVLSRMGGLAPEACLMVGNDALEDIASARALGMTTFFLTDCALNAGKGEVACDGRGSWDELSAFLDKLS